MEEEEAKANGGGDKEEILEDVVEGDADGERKDEEEVIVCEEEAGGEEDGCGTDFDRIVSCIEDIVVGDDFQEMQLSILERHCHHFDPEETGEEENKLVYTEVFTEYTDAVEGFICRALEERMPGADMGGFLRELESLSERPSGEVFEMLQTLTDFLAFKEMIKDFRRMRDLGIVDVGRNSEGREGEEGLSVEGKKIA